MMIDKLSTRLAVLLAGMALQCGIAGNAIAEQFKPPSLEGYMLHDERDADGDGDGVNETHIVQYLNTSGDSLVVWAWSLNTRTSETGHNNYVMRDSNCDGVFDEVYGLDEEFHVPECMK